MRSSFYQHNFHDVVTLLESEGLNPVGAKKLFNWYYKKKQTSFCEESLAKKTQDFVLNSFDFSLPSVTQIQEAEDRTVKLGVTLHDGKSVECVLIPFQGKYTLCISSQVGCAMKCSFCFTGTQGLKRHLKTEEIIGQFLVAWKWLEENRPEDHRIRNIVFMGQGEPLHNFDAVKKACEIFMDQHGMSLGIQKITISTSGYMPGLKRWIDEMPRVNIALSLHAMFTEKRNQLVTINQAYPIEEVLDLLETIPLQRKQYLTYEYLLAKDFNDTEEDAHAVGQRLKHQQAIINLIPFNPFPGTHFERSTDESIERFKKIIESYALPALIRGTKGDEILAACGQLNTSGTVKAAN